MSEVKVNKVSPRSGTGLQLGDSGDTITIPSGATLANSGTVTGIPTSALTGTIATAQIADDAVTLAKMAPGTDGNIISYDASGNPVAVATGSAGQVLTSAGAGAPPTFAAASGGTNTPTFEVRKTSGNQSISNTTWTKVNFETATFDADSVFDLANEKFTVPSGEAGKYFLYASIQWNNDDRGIRKVAFYKNGAEQKVIFDEDGHDQGSQHSSSGALLDLSASDYIEVYVYQSTGDPENVLANGEATYFGGFKLIE